MKLILTGKIFLLILLLLVLVNQGSAAFTSKNLASPQIIALGGAYTAYARDIDCLYDNTAGLGIIRDRNVLVNYARLLWGLEYEGISQFSGAVNSPLADLVNIGLSYYKLFTERYSENYITLGLGRKIFSDLFLGVSCNYLFWDSEPVKWFDLSGVEEDLDGKAISFDIGLLYQLLPEFRMGLVFQNINQPDISSGQGSMDTLEYTAKLGFYYQSDDWKFLVDFLFKGYSFKKRDIDNRVSEKQLGVEKAFFNSFLLARAGLNFYHFAGTMNISLGCGLDIKKYWSLPMMIDYAFVFPFNSIKGVYGSHYLGLKYKF